MFDYIIVGAGSAGCVLANRLSTNSSCQVLLLEAGGEDDSALIQMPALYGKLQDSPEDWADRTVPQTHLFGRRIFVPQGRVLGGSSAINFLIYMRGNRGDYDLWAKAGNAGWAYQDILPYFIKSETNHEFADCYHGNTGELHVSSHPTANPLVERYFAAAKEAGIAFNPDFNADLQEGYGSMQATIHNGSRCSSAAAYLHPIRNRSNLTVVTRALTTRLLFDGNRAIGVEYFRLGKVQQEFASGEIIVAAGALRSPQLLMLSGIGAADELQSLNITPKLDLPGVGKNLQDHLHTRVRAEITQPWTFAALPESAKITAQHHYETHRKGALASNFLEAGAFVKSHPDEIMPGLQLFFLMTLPPDYPEGASTNRHGITFTAYINRPESRGAVTLANNDPLARPLIDFNYLSSDADLRCAIAGVRWNLRILYGKAFDDIRGGEVAPGAKLRTDTELEDFVRRTASTTWHPAGTCKMGTDSMAVVDNCLRVHGIDALRVVDASIMPNIVSGNTNAPVMMIAEKAADMMLNGL